MLVCRTQLFIKKCWFVTQLFIKKCQPFIKIKINKSLHFYTSTILL